MTSRLCGGSLASPRFGSRRPSESACTRFGTGSRDAVSPRDRRLPCSGSLRGTQRSSGRTSNLLRETLLPPNHMLQLAAHASYARAQPQLNIAALGSGATVSVNAEEAHYWGSLEYRVCAELSGMPDR